MAVVREAVGDGCGLEEGVVVVMAGVCEEELNSFSISFFKLS